MKPSTGLAIAVLAVALSACAKSEQITLKLHHFAPPSSTIHAKLIVPWCETIEKESSGKLKCQIYPAMQLGGGPAQLYDQVKDGVVDIVLTIPGYSAGRFPRIEVFELPFMMKDAAGTSRALWDYVQQHDQDEFADVKPLSFYVHGPGYFHMVARPITRRDDLRGLKIRAPTRQTTKMIALLGATPVGMPLPQLPEALSKGVIDGTIVPYEIIPAIKANELTKFHSESDPSEPAIYTTTFLFAMNKAKYSSLPPPLRKVIDNNSGVELSAQFGKAISDADAGGRATVAPASINVITKAEIKRWRVATQPVIDDWVDEMNAKGADGNALLDSARSLIEKYGD